MRDEEVVLGAHRVAGGGALGKIAKAGSLLVIGGAGLSILLGVQDLVDIELLHGVARDAETVLLRFREGVAVVVGQARPINLNRGVVAGRDETFRARVESFTSVGSALDAEVGL